MSEEDILRSVNEIVAPYGLRAEIFGGIRRVCVRGDARAYLPVLNLIGSFPGYDVLAALSTNISNIFDIGGVTFQVAAATSVQDGGG